MKEEHTLCYNAKKWFVEQFNTTPEKKGYHCMKVWHKRMMPPAVVFAPNADIADIFISTQNKIFDITFQVFVGSITFIIITLLMLQNNEETFMRLFFVIGVVWVITFLFKGIILYRNEKIYKDKIIVYYS